MYIIYLNNSWLGCSLEFVQNIESRLIIIFILFITGELLMRKPMLKNNAFYF